MLSISPGPSHQGPSVGVALRWPRLENLSSSSSSGQTGLTARPPLSVGKGVQQDWSGLGRARVPARLPVQGSETKTFASGRNGHYLVATRCSATLCNGGQPSRPVAVRMRAVDHENGVYGSKTPLPWMQTMSLPDPNLHPFRLHLHSRTTDLRSRHRSHASRPQRSPSARRHSTCIRPYRAPNPQSRRLICMNFRHQRVEALHGHARLPRRRSRCLCNSPLSRHITMLLTLPGQLTTTRTRHGNQHLSRPPPLQRLHLPPFLYPPLGLVLIHNPVSTMRATTTIDISVPCCLGMTRWN